MQVAVYVPLRNGQKAVAGWDKRFQGSRLSVESMPREDRKARREEKQRLKEAKRSEANAPSQKRSFRLRNDRGARGARGDGGASGAFELVDGGRVRRIHFEGQQTRPREEPVHYEEETVEVQRVYRPKHVAPIPEIEFEIDHLDSIRAGYRPKGLPAGRRDLRRRTDTLYSTDRGSVLGTSSPVTGRQVLYTQGASVLSRRRFTEAAVDQIVKDVRLDDETVVRESVTEYVPRSKAEGRKTKTVRGKTVRKAAKPATPTKARKKTKKAKPAAKAAPPAVKDDGPMPQCLAITAGGKQCRNSSRHGSQYCGAHKGYRAPTASAVLAAAKDTKPRVKKAADTKPGTGTTRTKSGLQAQCAAVTPDGKQCRNSSRAGSKYCGSHKGFNPARAAKALVETKPRAKKGKDTKAKVRKK